MRQPPERGPVLAEDTATQGMLRPLRSLARIFAREKRCMLCQGIFTVGAASFEDGRPGVLQGPGQVLFCPACLIALARRERGYCPHCGEPFAWPALPLALCMPCSRSLPPWRAFIFHGLHEGLLRRALLGLKFGGIVPLGHALGALLASHPGLAALAPDVAVPVPLHARRLAARGYNQALEIARPVAEALAIPLRPNLLRRVKATKPQTGASLAARRANLREAFVAHEGVKGKSILLVDDTLTTGATLQAATLALREAGARDICVAVVSRTARKS